MGGRIRELREAKGLSQAELAALVGVKQQSVSAWEGGKAPGRTSLRRLEDALGAELWRQDDSGALLVIDLPAGTEYDEGETVFVVVRVKAGTELAEQLLANAPWATTSDERDRLIEEFDDYLEEGDALPVRVAGHDAKAMVIGRRGSGKSAAGVAELKAAAEKGKAAGARKATARKPRPRGDE